MFVGMDVHKETIDISVAEGGRQGEVRNYGIIPTDLEQLVRAILEWRAGGLTVTCFDYHESAGFQSVAHTVDGALFERVDDGNQIPSRASKLEFLVGGVHGGGVPDLRRLYFRKLGCHPYYTFDADDVIVRALWGARREHGPTI